MGLRRLGDGETVSQDHFLHGVSPPCFDVSAWSFSQVELVSVIPAHDFSSKLPESSNTSPLMCQKSSPGRNKPLHSEQQARNSS